MVSLMMSSQTKDPVTHQATQNLKRNLRHGLSLEGLLDATEAEIDAQICKASNPSPPPPPAPNPPPQGNRPPPPPPGERSSAPF